MEAHLFLSYICSTVVVVAFAAVFIFNNKYKTENGYIVIINIVINIKKGIGGSNGEFASEPSENFNLIFLRTDFADSIDFKRV